MEQVLSGVWEMVMGPSPIASLVLSPSPPLMTSQDGVLEFKEFVPMMLAILRGTNHKAPRGPTKCRVHMSMRLPSLRTATLLHAASLLHTASLLRTAGERTLEATGIGYGYSSPSPSKVLVPPCVSSRAASLFSTCAPPCGVPHVSPLCTPMCHPMRPLLYSP